MSERKETSSDGEQPITVRRLVSTEGITTRHIIRAARSALGDRPVRSLSIAVVSDADIALLHERYLAEAGPTDVLSFDLRDDCDSGPIEGEVVVSAETARRQAARLGLDEREELLRYVIHGTLHLVGLDDKTTGQRAHMRREENRILNHLAETRTAGHVSKRRAPQDRRLSLARNRQSQTRRATRGG